MIKSQILNFYDGRITIDPSICNGKPTIRGKRITPKPIFFSNIQALNPKISGLANGLPPS